MCSSLPLAVNAPIRSIFPIKLNVSQICHITEHSHFYSYIRSCHFIAVSAECNRRVKLQRNDTKCHQISANIITITINHTDIFISMPLTAMFVSDRSLESKFSFYTEDWTRIQTDRQHSKRPCCHGEDCGMCELLWK